MNTIQECPKCQSGVKFIKGISKKNNKPYQGYKCVNPECGHLEFISQPKTTTPIPNTNATFDEDRFYLELAVRLATNVNEEAKMACVKEYYDALKNINKKKVSEETPEF